jgi:hypothetical protein
MEALEAQWRRSQARTGACLACESQEGSACECAGNRALHQLRQALVRWSPGRNFDRKRFANERLETRLSAYDPDFSTARRIWSDLMRESRERTKDDLVAALAGKRLRGVRTSYQVTWYSEADRRIPWGEEPDLMEWATEIVRGHDASAKPPREFRIKKKGPHLVLSRNFVDPATRDGSIELVEKLQGKDVTPVRVLEYVERALWAHHTALQIIP